MNKASVFTFLECIGVPPSSMSVRSDWVGAPCPLAPWLHDSGKDSHPSFAIKINDSGESHFNCFTCRSGDLLLLLQSLKEFGAQKPKYRIEDAAAILQMEAEADLALSNVDYTGLKLLPEPDVVWPEKWLDTFKPSFLFPSAAEYLAGRDVTPAMQVYFELKYDPFQKTVCFPIRNWHGELVGLRGRHIDPGEGPPYHMYKYKGGHNKLPWFGEHLVDQAKPVLLVESVFDLVSAHRVYKNVLAPLTVGMSEFKVRRISSCVDLVTLFDRGTGGDKARSLVSKYMRGAYVKHLSVPDEINEKTGELIKDPGEMSPLQLVSVLEEHLLLDI